MDAILTLIGLVCYAYAIFSHNVVDIWRAGYYIIGSVYLIGGIIVGRINKHG